MIYREFVEMETETGKIYDLTKKIRPIVEQCLIKEGICNVFLTGTTAGLMINENNRMLLEDLKRLFELMAPDGKLYNHPDNAHSHIRASMLTQQLTIPIVNGRLELGEWQAIMLWEFDVRKRDRRIVVTIQGP
jgi:secondary thiamine-phosphate synthase enzyme